MQEYLLDKWPRLDGQFDLARAPMRLLAIVNRIDQRDLDRGTAGEPRLIFGVTLPLSGPRGAFTCTTCPFTVAVEYRMPAKTEADVRDWAQRWHALGALPRESEEFNAALQAITDRFTGRNAEPERPNGSALGQLRTNEFLLSLRWTLREFELTVDGMRAATVKQTPIASFRRDSPVLAAFINENESAILMEQHIVPPMFQEMPFLGAFATNPPAFWGGVGINNNEARHKFAMHTCDGCHSKDETGSDFHMIAPRSAGMISKLSPFLTGVTMSDPVSGESRSFNDLERRVDDLSAIVCGEPSPSARSRAMPGSVSLRKGISRVH